KCRRRCREKESRGRFRAGRSWYASAGDGSPKGMNMGLYFYSFAGASAAAVVFTPMVMRLSRVLGIVDRPNERKVHFRPTPRAGGVGIFAATALVVVPALLFLSVSGGGGVDRALWVALAATACVFILGLLDDVVDLHRA